MSAINRPLRVFLCHSSDDKSVVRELYERLVARGIDTWLDEKKLLPGQHWKTEIPKAIRKADAVIICLSKTSITKEGYVQKEIRYALELALEKPENTIYLIPTRLEDCKIPDSLSDWHWVNLFEPKGLDLIFGSLQLRADSLGLKIEVAEKFYKDKILFSNGAEFMHVPAGKFLMGVAEGLHRVDISYDYWIARYPITNEMYNAYIKFKKDKHPISDWKKKKDDPIVLISWRQATEYCRWLNNSLKDELPSGMILRLPTEKEWEKAARGVDGRLYPWGNEFDKGYCNTKENGINKITPVGMFSPKGNSPYGCADMAGNVWEWTYSFHKKISNTEPVPIIKGGSWEDDKVYSSYHDIIIFVKEDRNVGFRVVLVPKFLEK